MQCRKFSNVHNITIWTKCEKAKQCGVKSVQRSASHVCSKSVNAEELVRLFNGSRLPMNFHFVFRDCLYLPYSLCHMNSLASCSLSQRAVTARTEEMEESDLPRTPDHQGQPGPALPLGNWVSRQLVLDILTSELGGTGHNRNPLHFQVTAHIKHNCHKPTERAIPPSVMGRALKTDPFQSCTW